MPMRNLREILSNSGGMCDNAPKTIDVHEFRADAVNRMYESINSAHDWLNLQTVVDYPVYYNRTEDTSGFTVATTAASNVITFSGALGTSLTSGYLAAVPGMTFEGDDGETYTINRVTVASPTTMLLDRAYTTTGTVSTWTIRGDRFYLPRDCTRAMGFMDETTGVGRLQIVDRRTAEYVFSTQPDTTGTVYWMVDDDMEYDRPPDPGWTATDDTAAGSLAANSVYEVCYTFTYRGRESAPSPSVRVSTSAAVSHRIAVAGLEDTRDSSGLSTGIYKNIYIRHLTRGTDNNTNSIYSRWLYVTQLTEATTSTTITGFPTPNSAELYYTNGRKYMRTEWIPGADVTLRLRYLRAPPRLVSDSSVPQWPEAFHDILVYGTAIDIGLQLSIGSGKIDRWQKLHDDLLKKYMAAQINVPDAKNRRMARVIAPNWGGFYLTNGNATTDFSGS